MATRIAGVKATTVLNRERTRGQKSGVPRIAELSPSAITTDVQAHGHWFLTHKVLERLYNEACESVGIIPNADYEQVLPDIYNRIASGVNQRAAKGDVPEGMRYHASKLARRGAHKGIGVTLVPVKTED